MKVCKVEGCDRESVKRGMCNKHYLRVLRYNDPSRGDPQGCSVDGCMEKHQSKGFCENHYRRFLRHGDPLSGRTVPGSLSQWVLENLSYSGDDCLIWPFCRLPNGRALIHIGLKYESVHVVMCTIVHGPKPTPKHEVAHSCGNGHLGCVAPLHTRWATHSENIKDRVEHGTDNRGEKNLQATLSNLDVISLVSDLSNRMSQCNVAKKYGIAQSTVSSIKLGGTWSWLTGNKRKCSVG